MGIAPIHDVLLVSSMSTARSSAPCKTSAAVENSPDLKRYLRFPKPPWQSDPLQELLPSLCNLCLSQVIAQSIYEIMQPGQDLSLATIVTPFFLCMLVGDMQTLSQHADQDGLLKQKLLQVLGIGNEKWSEIKEHAAKAVVADNRMRAWYANPQQMDMGLLFITQMGKTDLDRPVGKLTNSKHCSWLTYMDLQL